MLDSYGISHLLECFFNSDSLWQSIRKHLGVGKAADKVLAYNDEQKNEFFRACLRYASDHRWEYTQSLPSDQQVFRVLITLAQLIAKSGKATPDDLAIVNTLGEAVDRKNKPAIVAWVKQYPSWSQFDGSDWLKVFMSIMVHTAMFFDKEGEVSR